MALSGRTINQLERTTGLTQNSLFAVVKSGTTEGGDENGTYSASINDIYKSQIYLQQKLYPDFRFDGDSFISINPLTFSHDSVLSSWANIFKAFVNGGAQGLFTGNTTGENGIFNYGVQRSAYISQTTAVVGANDTSGDLFSGTTNSFGSRNFSSNFFSQSSNYKAKTIKITAYGRFVSTGSHTIDWTIYIGGSPLTFSYLGPLSIQSTDDNWSLKMDIPITNTNARIAGEFNISHSTDGTIKSFPFYNPGQQDISAFNGGDIQMLVGPATDADAMLCDYVKIELLS